MTRNAFIRRTVPPSLLPVLVLVGTLLAAGCGGEGGDGGPALPPTPRPDFDAARAHRLLVEQVAFGPRVPGTPGHARQLEWMDSLLTLWTDSVEHRPLTFTTSLGHELELTNLLARVNPEAEHRILLLAHWDTRPWSDMAPDPAERDIPVPGANDGASGTAVLLHLAELMAAEPPPMGVDLFFVDGEDYGPEIHDMLIGSRHFAREMENPPPWRYGILLDMVGDMDPRFPMEEYSARYAPTLTQRIWRVAAELGYGRYFPPRVGTTAVDDHVPLNEAGLPTVNIIDFDYPPWHTPRDTPENTSPQGLKMVGEVVAEIIYRGG